MAGSPPTNEPERHVTVHDLHHTAGTRIGELTQQERRFLGVLTPHQSVGIRTTAAGTRAAPRIVCCRPSTAARGEGRRGLRDAVRLVEALVVGLEGGHVARIDVGGPELGEHAGFVFGGVVGEEVVDGGGESAGSGRVSVGDGPSQGGRQEVTCIRRLTVGMLRPAKAMPVPPTAMPRAARRTPRPKRCRRLPSLTGSPGFSGPPSLSDRILERQGAEP
jgi:hypothetical protein